MFLNIACPLRARRRTHDEDIVLPLPTLPIDKRGPANTGPIEILLAWGSALPGVAPEIPILLHSGDTEIWICLHTAPSPLTPIAALDGGQAAQVCGDVRDPVGHLLSTHKQFKRTLMYT